MGSNEEQDRQTVGDGCAALIVGPAILMLRAFIVGKIWGWHLTPLVGMSPPPFATLFGLTLLAGVLSPIFISLPKSEPDVWLSRAVMFGTFGPLMLLLMAWVATLM